MASVKKAIIDLRFLSKEQKKAIETAILSKVSAA